MVAALKLAGVRKSFDGFVALDDAEFRGSERRSPCAPWAKTVPAKSSLMNVAAGLYAPEAGSISVNGEGVVLTGPGDAAACRIGMVHQEFKLVRPFTVTENVLLANWRGRYAPGVRDDRTTNQRKGRRTWL